MRVFLDANILFSAAKSDGAVRELLHLLLDAGHECWVDDYVVVEARRNLTTKGPEALSAFEALLARVKVAAAQAPAPTRDRTHFGAGYGRIFGGVAIHSPRSLAESVFG